ncbi:hypothetical protein BGZ75_000084 [Mortierella antarctica]|nr:hypothetical protein BGZ75_000084 [Mortierella antarctica]
MMNTSQLHDVLEKARAECGIVGMSVAVLYKGDLVFAEGFGKRNLQDPFTAETLAPIASLTKAFTAAAIGELVAEGLLDWDQTAVNTYLPEFQVKDPGLTSQLTLADMLSHRTGLPELDLAWFQNRTARRELIHRLRHVEMDTKLRPKCLYNNVMYTVAAEAAASISGMSYEQLVRNKILAPLGLNSSGFSQAELRKHPNHSRRFDAASFEEAQQGRFEMGELDMHAANAPAGDMFSNVLDLVRWGRTILHGGKKDGQQQQQVLNESSVKEMLSGQSFMSLNGTRRSPDFAPVVAYGLGWILDSYKGQVVYRHGGSNPGFRSNLVLFPDRDLVIAHLANVNVTELPDSLPYYLTDELLGLPKTQDWLEFAVKKTQNMYRILATLAQPELPAKSMDRPPTLELEAFLGEYWHPVHGDVSIQLGENKSLVFQMRSFRSEMIHHDLNVFGLVLSDFALKLGASVHFQTSVLDKVMGFRAQVADMVEGVLEFTKKEGKELMEE